MNPTLSIIIVNWNTGNQLRACLQSIRLASREGFVLSKVVVVDNASSDGSASGLGEIALPLLLLQNQENRGFSAACNQGACLAGTDYLLFLNPDTQVFETSLTKPLAFLERSDSKDIGILGVQLVNQYGTIEHSCARFPSASRFLQMALGLDRLCPRLFPAHFMTEWDHKGSREVEQIMGSFFLVRGSLFKNLGGFDERFFVYFEEVDFSLRARLAGFRSYFFAETSVFHKGGGSSEKVKALRLFYSLRSRIQYLYKHGNWFAATGGTLVTLLIEPIARLALATFKFSIEGILETTRGYALLWRAAPRLIANEARGGK